MGLHAELEAKFRSSNGRNLRYRKLANHTYLERREGGKLAVRLHRTDVVTIEPDDTLTLNSGGWYTMTTSERINRFLSPRGFCLWSDRGRWYLGHRWNDRQVPFADGTVVTAYGQIISPEDAPTVEEQEAHNRRMNALIDGYIAHILPHKVTEAGRCDGCEAPSEEHLISHLEGLTLTSTLANAALQPRHPNYWRMMVRDAERGRVNRYFTGRIRAYLRRKLLRGVATR